MIRNILLIGAGGFIGSVARYYVSKINLTGFLHNFPAGTLLVNVTGSLVIGILMAISERSDILTPEARLFLMVGLCGGFTTFSTFAMENLTMMHNGQFVQALSYTSLSVILGFLAVWAGYQITNLF